VSIEVVISVTIGHASKPDASELCAARIVLACVSSRAPDDARDADVLGCAN
jgi:hypothetical protein